MREIESARTRFLGYATTTASGRLLEIVAKTTGIWLIFDQSPFFAQMGGQAGDQGTALIGGQLIPILDTVADEAGRHLHKVEIRPGGLAGGDVAVLTVDSSRRQNICRHHTAAHLLCWALGKILGPIAQDSAHMTENRIRFDFAHSAPLSAAQLGEVEGLVNERIIENARVDVCETDYERRPGRLARVVDIGGYCRQFCGGTHVNSTSEICLFKIARECATATGVRRIEAVAGHAAYELVSARERALFKVSASLAGGVDDVEEKLQAVMAHRAELERRLRTFEGRRFETMAAQLVAGAQTVGSLKFISGLVQAESAAALRSIGSRALEAMGEGVVRLGSIAGSDGMLAVFCSGKAVESGFRANALLASMLDELGGRGGGNERFAMGGSPRLDILAAVFSARSPE